MSLGFNFLNMLGLGGTSFGTSNTLGQLFSGTNSIFGCGYNNYNYVSCGSRGRSASHGIGQYIGMAFASLGMNLLGGLASKALDKIFNPSEEDKSGNKQGTSLESLKKQKADINTKLTTNANKQKENSNKISTLTANLDNPLGDKKQTYETNITNAQAALNNATEENKATLQASLTQAQANLNQAKQAKTDAETKAKAQINAEIDRLKAENEKLEEQETKLKSKKEKITEAIAKLEKREVKSLTGQMSDESYVNLFDNNNELVEANGVTPDYTAAYKTAMKKLSNKNNTEADKKKYAKQVVALYGKLNKSEITQTMESVKSQAEKILTKK